MTNKNYKISKILILITIGVFSVTSICLIPPVINYFSTGSDVTAVALIFAGSLCLMLTAVPCLVMAAFGTVHAAKARIEGIGKARKFLVMGIVEIAVYGMGIMGTMVAVLIMILSMGRW